MRMFGLTELGHVLQLDVTDTESDSSSKTKIIKNASVLDTENSAFSLEYTPTKHGELVMETITENPKDIYDRISKARTELDRRELAFMAHLFITHKEEYSVSDLLKTSQAKVRRLRSNAKAKEIKNADTDSADDTNKI